MTFSLRRKRLTTVPVPPTRAQTETDPRPSCLALAAGALLLLGHGAWAQAPSPPADTGSPADSPSAPLHGAWAQAPSPPATTASASDSPSAPLFPRLKRWQSSLSAKPAASTPVPRRAESAPPASYTTGTMSWTPDKPTAPTPVIQQVVMQRPLDNRGAVGDETQDYHIRLTAPGPELLFRRDSEEMLKERMRQEALSLSRPERIEFPREEPELTKEPYKPRVFPPITGIVEPNYVAYRRLGFEQINFERYGWDLGILTPFVSAATFYKDVLLLPYHMGTEPCRRYECNTGYCLPGSPVPLLLYPPEFSLTGTFLEASAVAGILLVFPG